MEGRCGVPSKPDNLKNFVEKKQGVFGQKTSPNSFLGVFPKKRGFRHGKKAKIPLKKGKTVFSGN
jgi:hypothetical protein